MAISWTIQSVEYTNDPNKGVVQVAWEIKDSETVNGRKHRGRYVGGSKFTPDPSDSEYLPFDTLTEANIIDWVKTQLGSDEVTRLESKVTTQISKSKEPETLMGFPWQPPAEIN